MSKFIATQAQGAPLRNKIVWILNKYPNARSIINVSVSELEKFFEPFSIEVLIAIVRNKLFDKCYLLYNEEEFNRVLEQVLKTNVNCAFVAMPRDEAWVAAGMEPGDDPEAPSRQLGQKITWDDDRRISKDGP